MAGYGQQPGYSYQLAPQYYPEFGLPSVQTALVGTEVNTAVSGTGFARQHFGTPKAGYVGYGYGQRVAAPRDIQVQYAGKPSFFDASRGILWDATTQTAYFYAPTGSSVAATIGAAPCRVLSSANLATAIENVPRIFLGNGTAGNVEEHRNAICSFYLLDAPCQ